MERTRAPSSAREEAESIWLSDMRGESCRGWGPFGPQYRFSLGGLSRQFWRPDQVEYCEEEEEEEKHLALKNWGWREEEQTCFSEGESMALSFENTVRAFDSEFFSE